MPSIKQKLSGLPDAPGVYLFFDAKKKLMYVGKATSLKSRVRSYFASHPLRSSTTSPSGRRRDLVARPIERMIREVKDIKWEKTESVLEAIILEANYIRKLKPKYNVLGTDDKSWNYLVITKDEYPRVGTMRQHEFENLLPLLQSKQLLLQTLLFLCLRSQDSLNQV